MNALFFAAVFVAGVVTFPAPVVRSVQPYEVSVNGSRVEIVSLPAPDHHLTGDDAKPYSAAFFDSDEEVEIEIAGRPMKDVRVLPLSKGIRPKIVAPDRIRFKAKPPFTYAVEPSGRHDALILVANAIEKNPPRKGDSGVVWIGPGSHYRDKPLVLGSGETLYLAPGAYLESAVVAKGTNITICGHGILSGARWAHEKGPRGAGNLVTMSGRDLKVRDVTLMSSFNWTLVFKRCEKVAVDNVRVLGGRVLNDDGIDLCEVKGAAIRNCFIRSQDDCITPKWWCEDVLVENCALWTDSANIFRIGYECTGKEKEYRNLVFRDIDVLHQAMPKRPASAYWSHHTVFIQAGNDQCLRDMLFENLRFDSPEPCDRFFTAITFKVNDQWQHHREAGHVRNIRVRNVAIPRPFYPNTLGVRLDSMDSEHRVEGIVFENVSGLGCLETKGDVRNVEIPKSSFVSADNPSKSAPVAEGVFTIDVSAGFVKDGLKPMSLGLTLRGEKDVWGLTLFRRPSSGKHPGERTFEFVHHHGKNRWVSLGEKRLYSRKKIWDFGRSYRITLALTGNMIVASIVDDAGTEVFAEAWQFGSLPYRSPVVPELTRWNFRD